MLASGVPKITQTMTITFNYQDPQTRQMVHCTSFDDMKRRLAIAGLDKIPAVQRLMQLEYRDGMDPSRFLSNVKTQLTPMRPLAEVKTTPKTTAVSTIKRPKKVKKTPVKVKKTTPKKRVK